MDYNAIAERIKTNGEPGVAWLENMRKYGRMNGKDEGSKDKRVKGGNPCLGKCIALDFKRIIYKFIWKHSPSIFYVFYIYVSVHLGVSKNNRWSRSSCVSLSTKHVC